MFTNCTALHCTVSSKGYKKRVDTLAYDDENLGIITSL
jgi:hypothetical protein